MPNSFQANNRQEIKRFLLLSLKVAVLILLTDQLFRLFRQEPHPIELEGIRHEDLLRSKMLNKEYRDVYYLGSSMTQSGINPEHITINLTQWNAGIAGRSNILWQLELIEFITKNKLANHIVYAVEVFSFPGKGTNELISPKSDSILFPFLLSHKYSNEFKSYIATSLKGLRIQSFPALKKKPIPLPPNRTINCCQLKLVDESGWLNTFKTLANPTWIYTRSLKFARPSESVSKKVKDVYRSLAKANITLTYVILPNFLEYGDAKSKELQIKSYNHLIDYLDSLNENNLGFQASIIDGRFFNPEIVNDHNYFYDSVHLNSSGSEIFSKWLSDQLSDILPVNIQSKSY